MLEIKKIDPLFDLFCIAKMTPEMSGAQLEAVLNETSILTVRNNKDLITKQ